MLNQVWAVVKHLKNVVSLSYLCLSDYKKPFQQKLKRFLFYEQGFNALR